MDIGEMIQKAELIRDYEVIKAHLKGTLKLISIRNQDIDEQFKIIDAIRAGEETEASLREAITAISDDLDELDFLMTKKKQYENRIKDFGIEEK